MKKRSICCLLLITILTLAGCGNSVKKVHATEMLEDVSQASSYYFPSEEEKHEGTWLIWPHQHTYGIEYRKAIEDIWVQMTAALHSGENIHIIAFDDTEKQRIKAMLIKEGIDMNKIDFVMAKSDDVWARDTGPLFVFDEAGKLTIADFAFDGWGEKVPYQNDDKIPLAAAKAKQFPVVEIADFVLEGGAVELDGEGTLLAAKSSVVSKNRNPHLSVTQAEAYLSKYLGVSNFIWLEGVIDQDITDAHIDGMARFYDSETLLTVSQDDFFDLYDDIPKSDYIAIKNAKNAKGIPYERIELPMTAQNVEGLDYKGLDCQHLFRQLF